MPNNTERARKLLVRTALVTSTTIATLVGAQNFAMLDARAFQSPTSTDSPNSVSDIVVLPIENTPTPMPVVAVAPDIQILQAAPHITILRQAGQTSPSAQKANPVAAVSTNNQAVNIQPPAPMQIAAPQPVVVQQPQPVTQRSRSSR